MRTKNFTLMLFAFLVSAVCLAGKPTVDRKAFAYDRHVMAQKLTKQSYAKTGLDQYLRELPAPKASNTAKKAPAKAPEVVTPPAGGEVEYFTLTGTNSKGGQTSRTVKLIWDGLDIVYISGLSYYLPDAFVKGTYNEADETFVFASGQYLGNISDNDFYFAASSDGKTLADAVANFDELAGTFTFTDYLLIDNGDPKEIAPYAYWTPGVTLSPVEGDIDMPVEIPSDLEIETYAYTAYDYFSDNAAVSGNLNIGIYGDEVYVQGMSLDYPEAWIKGTFTDETTIAFPSGQLLSANGQPYFVAYNNGIVDEYILLYDPETGSFEEGDNAPMISSAKTSLSLWQFYYGYEIKPITEKAAVPANSSILAMAYNPSSDALEFNLASVDTDGEGLVMDKVAYIIYRQDESGNPVAITLSKSDYGMDEDLTEIPASFNGGNGSLPLYMEHSSWTKIGIQTVYYGGEERNVSEITWYTPTWPITVTLPSGLEVTEHTFKGELYDSDGNIPFERTVGLALDGNDMYIRGLGEANEDAWVKGTMDEDGNYIFPKGQTMGMLGSTYRVFLVGKGEAISDVVLKVDETNGVYEFQNVFLENVKYTDKSYYYNYYEAGATIAIAEVQEEEPEVVVVPEGLNTEVYSFAATDYFDDVPVAHSVNVGFDGADVYVQGISECIPEAWVKGTLEGNQITFAAGQYLGKYKGTVDLWFIGYNLSRGLTNYVMTFDEETYTMSNLSERELIGINAYKNKVSSSLYEFYYTASIKKITEKIATPATPTISTMMFAPNGNIVEFNIPVMDVEGDGLITDKLSYKLYYDEGDGEAHEVTFTTDLYTKLKEDMTVIPYGFLDDVDEKGNPTGFDFYAGALYLNMDHNTWKRVGIQSIYTGGDETNASEIGWYTIIWPTVAQLPDDAELKSYCLSGTYYRSSGSQNFTKEVSVAMVGDSIYVQGVGRANSVAWIKGTKTSEDTYTFSKGQYMGNYGSKDDYSYLFLMGYNSTLGVMDVKMKLDAETGIFTFTTEIIENSDYTDNLYYLTRILSGAQLSPSDAPDAISTVAVEAAESSARYSISGQRVGKNFKGIVIENGKKFFQK